MNDPEIQRDLIADALEAAKSRGLVKITTIREMPTGPGESRTIAVTATRPDGRACTTTVMLETDGSGIYHVDGPDPELRREIQRIAEAAIA